MSRQRPAFTIALLLLALAVAFPACAEDFWFAAVADTHVRDEASAEIVVDAIEMIDADERIAMSIWLGDITDRSTEQEFILSNQILETCEKPWHPLRGNHDDKEGLYEQYFGPINYRFEHGGWVFLIMDSNGPKDTIVTDETMAWLREQVQATDPASPVVLCCHHPLILGGIVPLAGAPDILKLLEGHNLKAVLAGHLHTNQVHTVDGVLHTVNACCATTRKNIDGDPRRGYRLFHCSDGEITTEFVTVREIPEERQQ